MQSKPQACGGYFPARLVLFIVVFSLGNLSFCKITMAEVAMHVTLSVSGLPPSYIERRRQVEIPAQQHEAFNALLAKAHFFELPGQLGGNAENGRDMGVYSITVSVGVRQHTVEFSDSSITQELADLMNWLKKIR
jgi:hypothetical protein